PVHEFAEGSLTDRIRDPESDRDVRVIRIRPAILEFEIRGEQREGLPVNVVDNRRAKQKTANPPAHRRYRANSARSASPPTRHAASTLYAHPSHPPPRPAPASPPPHTPPP